MHRCALILIAACLTGLFSGCPSTKGLTGSFSDSAPNTKEARTLPNAEAPTSTDTAVKIARDDVERLKGELAAAEAKEKATTARAKLEATEARARWMHRVVLILSGICLLGVVAFVLLAVAARIWGLGLGVKPALGLAGGFLAALLVLQATDVLIDHPYIVAGVLVALIAVGVIWMIAHYRRLSQVAREGLHVGVQALSMLPDADAAQIKLAAEARQTAAGTLKFIQSGLDRVKQIA